MELPQFSPHGVSLAGDERAFPSWGCLPRLYMPRSAQEYVSFVLDLLIFSDAALHSSIRRNRKHGSQAEGLSGELQLSCSGDWNQVLTLPVSRGRVCLYGIYPFRIRSRSHCLSVSGTKSSLLSVL